MAVESAKQINGRTHLTFLVTETGVGASSEWSFTTPEHFTITVFEAELTTAGDTSTIRPEFGIAASWTVNQLNHAFQAGSAAAYIRNEPQLRVSTSNGVLYGRSKPNGSNAGEINTRITVVEGHDW